MVGWFSIVFIQMRSTESLRFWDSLVNLCLVADLR